MLRPAFRFLAVIWCLAACFATPATADLWYEHYEKGDQALREKNWNEAVRQFSQALEKKGEPGVQVRTYGMNFINYHPYLKLGIAYYNMGQFDRALQAFESEKTLGAIGKSAPDLKNLETYQRLALEAATATEHERIAGVVADSLREARALEEQGKLDDAMAAMGKGLAVDPKHAEANATMERLRKLVAAQQAGREMENRFAKLLAEGESLVDGGKYQEASSALQQALSLKPEDPEAKSLLAESQEKLKQEIETAQGARSRQALVADGLAEALRLEQAGSLDEALRRLQSVLAVEPAHREALSLQERLVKRQGERDSLAARAEEVARLLEGGAGLLQKGEFQQSVATFTRAIALDPTNASARTYLAKAFASMSQAILGGAGAPAATKLPPIIVIANRPDSVFRWRGAEVREFSVQRVPSSGLNLSGVILDDQPAIKVAFVREALGGTGGEREAASETALDATSKTGDFYHYDFTHLYQLEEGPATLRMVVTDADGLTTEQTHHVLYAPPLIRKRWFQWALAIGGLTALGGSLGYRINRRNRLLKRRFNPYVAGAPVLDDDLFVGREALLSRILQTIHNNSILLYGERRIGKTSLQHHLKKRLQKVQDPEYDFYPVYIDLQGTPQERFFATLAQDTFAEIAPHLDGGAEPRERVAPPEYDYNMFIRDIHDVLVALKKRSKKKVKLVWLIDEVDELNNYDPRVNQRLRSLFMKSFAEDLVAVVSGVGIKKQWASEGSPWYNFFEEIEVKPFTRKDAEELIQRPIHGIFRLEDGVVDRIISNSGCKPYLIQKLCIALVNRMHDHKRRRITIADVEAVGRPVEA